MKVLMTCAGINTELRPFTDMMPKCLLPINGKSILTQNLDWLQKFDIDEVIVSTSYYANQIDLALRKYQSNYKLTIHRQPKIIGTARTLKNLQYKLEDSDFMFLHGDNLYNFDVEKYHNVHKNNSKMVSILSHMTKEDSKNKSFIKYKDDSDKIDKFTVKPDYKMSKELLATSGVCFMNPTIFNYIDKRDRQVFDNVIPKILDNLNVIVDNNSVRFYNTRSKYMSTSNTWPSYECFLSR